MWPCSTSSSKWQLQCCPSPTQIWPHSLELQAHSAGLPPGRLFSHFFCNALPVIKSSSLLLGDFSSHAMVLQKNQPFCLLDSWQQLQIQPHICATVSCKKTDLVSQSFYPQHRQSRMQQVSRIAGCMIKGTQRTKGRNCGSHHLFTSYSSRGMLTGPID